jgi:hypothetical protein
LAAPQGLLQPLHGANSKLSGGQLILEVCFTHCSVTKVVIAVICGASAAHDDINV